MGRIARMVWGAIYWGLVGALFTGIGGGVIGAGTGVVFGGVQDGIRFGAFFGAVVGGAACAVVGLLWNDEFGTSWFGRRNAMNKPAVLFLCTNNAVRSQMAEALLRKRAADSFEAYSAGTEPREIHPLTVRVMREVGIDLSGQRPKDLRQFLGKLSVRFAIFVCQRAEVKCPTLWPGALNRPEWPFEDPAAQEGSEDEQLARFRSVRDQIDRKISAWLTELAVSRQGAPRA